MATAEASSIKHQASSRQFPAPVSAFPPSRFPLSVSTNQLLLATADFTREPGVVLDYNELDEGSYDMEFVSETYLIRGEVDITGYIYLSGCPIFKFASDSDNPTLVFNGPMDHWDGAIFTSSDDDSVGEVIDGSTGNPSREVGPDMEGGAVLFEDDWDPSVSIGDSDFRFMYVGLQIDCNADVNVGHQTFQSCYLGLDLWGGPDNSVAADLISSCNTPYPVNNNNGCSFSGSYDSANCDDIDGNGLPDWWEIQYFGHFGVDPNGDANNNGVSNLQEYQNGTIPTDLDADNDGLPDWWEWHWFGTYAYSGTNVDANGSTFLDDYNAYADPNPITFTIEVTNNYVNTTNPPLELNITGGVPFYYTVAVDNTNYLADTNSWIAFTSTNITASLGTNQGWHDVWVGVKGLPAEASVTWIWKRLKLDTLPPVIVITNPVNGTVDVPMIQLTGYSPEELDHISCDVSNALGTVTNLDAGVTDRTYSTNTWEFTTNYFECLDIPLTNGVNLITVHAMDLAGNVTDTNFSFTLDYSGKTNPPVVQITWPQDGMNLSGTNFTLRGQVNDPTVTVTASITDTNGDTNTVTGEVERNGRFWLEGLPLNTGTNMLSITVSDVVSNTTVTNLNLVQSALTLTLTPVSDDSQLWQPTISVAGTVSDSSDAIWVNGVQGTNNGDGTWSATNVPVSTGGVANFDVTAYPSGEAPGGSLSGAGINPRTADAADASSDPDKPVRLYVESYLFSEHSEVHPSGNRHNSVGAEAYSFGASEVHTRRMNWDDGQDSTADDNASTASSFSGWMGDTLYWC